MKRAKENSSRRAPALARGIRVSRSLQLV